MASKLGIMSIVFKKVCKGIYNLLEIVLVLKYFHGKEKLTRGIKLHGRVVLPSPLSCPLLVDVNGGFGVDLASIYQLKIK
jgi:hypothetical protein